MCLILFIQPFRVAVQTVTVEHGKLARSDHAGTGSWIVTPLDLHLIDQCRELTIRLDDIPCDCCNRLFMGHGQHHITTVAVFEPAHFFLDRIPASGFLPNLGRMDDRQGYFLATYGIHFFPDDAGKVGECALCQGQVSKDAAGERAQITGLDKELIPGYLVRFCRPAQRLIK